MVHVGELCFQGFLTLFLVRFPLFICTEQSVTKNLSPFLKFHHVSVHTVSLLFQKTLEIISFNEQQNIEEGLEKEVLLQEAIVKLCYMMYENCVEKPKYLKNKSFEQRWS